MVTMRRGVIATALMALAAGLVWLRDMRVSYARARLESKIVDRKMTIEKLQSSLSTLRDYLQTETPLESRFAGILREQNRQLTDPEFRLWFEQSEAKLREGAENDCRMLPAMVEERQREVKGMEHSLRALGRPWFFGGAVRP